MAEPVRLLVAGVSWPLETFLTRLFRGLLEAGIEVTVACSRRPPRSWTTRSGFRWVRTATLSSAAPLQLVRLGLQTCGALMRAPRLSWQTLTRTEPDDGLVQPAESRLRVWNRVAPLVGRPWDVVYFPWNSAAIAHRPLFGWGIPVVISCRGSQVNVAPYNPRRQSIRSGLRYTLQRATAVHCVSGAIRDEIGQYGVDFAKVRVIRPAVDPEFFRPSVTPTGSSARLRVVSTGSLNWVKGYEYALGAVRLLVHQGIPVALDIIGDGPERQRVLYTIQDMALEGHVRLLGKLPPDAVRCRLQQADVFLLSSLSEGISNAALEAMACGVPVITTDCGGMREAVTSGVEGFVVPTRASQAMAESLEVLWQNPSRRAEMGAAARRRIECDFRLDQQVGQFVKLILSACGR